MEIDLSARVDVVDELTPEEFRKNYLIPEKPVVIRKLWKDYPAVKKWTTEYFKNTLGDIKIGLFSDEETYLDRSFKTPHTFMKFGEYLDLIAREPTNLRMFLFNPFRYKPDLRNDFDYPDITKGFLKRFPFMFFGGKNSTVRIHQDMDMSNVFLTQLHGRKRVILFDPSYSDLLYRFPYSVHSAVDIDHPDYEKFPGLRYVKGVQCTINNGETLFIPSGWWHFITYLEGGWAISQRALSPYPIRRLDGFWRVVILSSIDDIMRKVLAKRWFIHKEKLCIRKANRAIRLLEKKGLNEYLSWK